MIPRTTQKIQTGKKEPTILNDGARWQPHMETVQMGNRERRVHCLKNDMGLRFLIAKGLLSEWLPAKCHRYETPDSRSESAPGYELKHRRSGPAPMRVVAGDDIQEISEAQIVGPESCRVGLICRSEERHRSLLLA